MNIVAIVELFALAVIVAGVLWCCNTAPGFGPDDHI